MLLAASADNSAAPGTLGFIVVFGLAVILVFVFRSMSKHIRKVDDAARRNEAAASSTEATDGAEPGSERDTAAASSPDRRA
jgi:Na+-transporting methylmalonyl-CoA/oxaloacetate decarboxylase gamma subunit